MTVAHRRLPPPAPQTRRSTGAQPDLWDMGSKRFAPIVPHDAWTSSPTAEVQVLFTWRFDGE